MNKYIKASFFYAILGLVAGVFYREFTKFNGLDGGTSLAYMHVHILTLGTVFFLILSLFEDKLHMSRHKNFKLFTLFYNIGLLITIAVFLARGVMEVLGTNVSVVIDKSLSGIGGLGHIGLGVGIVIMMLILNKTSKELDKAVQ